MHRRRMPLPRRAVALALFGCMYGLYALNLWNEPHLLPGPQWVPVVLFFSGAAGAGAALLHRNVHTEWRAFTWLYSIAALFALGHVAGLLLDSGVTQPVEDSIEWVLIAALVALVAGWAEPCPPAVLRSVRKAQQRANADEGASG